jgi:hypothetical protein
MAETIFSIERGPGPELIIRFKPKTLHVMPAPVRGHLRAARREVLLAFRRALDEAISAMEREEKPREKADIEIE